MKPAMGYTKMKDSGIPWMGEIPSEWNIRALFQLVNQVKCKNSDLREQNLLSLSYGKIKRKNIDKADGLLPASFDGYNIIENGDIVLRLTDLQNDHTSLRVGHATERGIITSAYTTLRPTNPSMSKYIYYLLHTFDIKKGFYGMGSGVRQGLNFDEVKMLKVPVPSVEEQTAIVDYLDTQCAKIDEIIAEAKASIEDYKQWKTSVVNDAVTHGLNTNVSMVDSGTYWIGRVPKHWRFSRLKYMFGIKKDIAGELGHTVLAITQQGVKPKNMSDKGQFALDYSKYQLVNPGDFAMNHMDLLTGWVDISEYTGVTSPDYRVFYALNPDKIHTNYYKHLFQTCYRCRIFYGLGQGVSGFGRWRLPAEIFLNFVLPVPPLEEQKEIADFLDKQCSQIDGVISEKQTLIADLEAYKKSLIYEVVTGKRCIPSRADTTVVAIHPAYQKALLMCRVLDLLGNDVRGRIHVQKCLFAVECLLKMPFQTQYARYEHGPYDTRITDCEALLSDNNWFVVQNGSPVTYQKGTSFEAYLAEYMKAFGSMDSNVKAIVEFLKPMKTSQAERVATLLAVWNDFILDGTATPTDQQIIDAVMTNWTPNKANTQASTWQDTLNKLKQKGFVPQGFGLHTTEKEAQEVQ